MEFQDKEFLNRLMELTEENNKILKKMWRLARIGRAIRILYWVIIIGLSIGAFYFIQPYVDQLLSVYSGFSDTAGSLKGFVSPF